MEIELLVIQTDPKTKFDGGMRERKMRTLSVPNRSKLSFAAASMESFLSAPGVKPGALVWITYFAGAPSAPRAFSLPSCSTSAKNRTTIAN